MNIVNKKKIAVISLCAFFLVSVLPIKAANVSPYGNYSASAYCGVYEGQVSVSVSNGTLVSADNWCDRGKTVSATAKAGASGSSSMSVRIIDAIDLTIPSQPKEAGTVTIGGITVNIVKPSDPGNSGNGGNGSGSGNGNNNSNGSGNGNETTPPTNNNDGKSSEASLASLSVDQGKLNPTFSEDVTSYELGLTDEVKSITVDAKAKDSKATISGNGAHELKTGTNDINIAVMAENGSVKTYTIHVTVEEKPKDYLTYNGQKLGILTNIDGVTAPDGFVRSDVKVGKKKINGWYNATSKIYFVYLADKDMIKHFYMVENGKITSIYQPVTLFGKSLVMIDVPKVLQKKTGMKFTNVTIDNQKLPGWTFLDKQFANYSLIYVMNPSGKVLYYQYEKTENTLQLFSGAAAITMADYDKEKDTGGSGNAYVMYGALGISAVLAAGLVYMYLRNKKNVAYLMTQRRIQFQESLDEGLTKENTEE